MLRFIVEDLAREAKKPASEKKRRRIEVLETRKKAVEEQMALRPVGKTKES